MNRATSVVLAWLPLAAVALIGAANIVLWVAWWPILTGYIREGDPLRILAP